MDCISIFDLQLAAELGKQLLERNKELETSVKNFQNLIEDQSEEIEYLTKQTAALKEVNTSRIKIYEQLEISVQELESSKECLLRQSVSDRKQIKCLQENIESLESRCEDLQVSLNRVKSDLENEKKQKSSFAPGAKAADKECFSNLLPNKDKGCNFCAQNKSNSIESQKIIQNLRDQTSLLLQENNLLHEQLAEFMKKNEELRSVQEELATFEEIRVGNLCKRCLRSTIPTDDCSSADEISIGWTNDEEREFSESIIASFASDVDESHIDNPYRTLVEKYEALKKIQEQQNGTCKRSVFTDVSNRVSSRYNNCQSLRDELQQSGNFYETDSEFEDEHNVLKEQKNKRTSAVTSSPSHLGGNILNKGTQTELLAVSLPGSFLCKISDGNDCQFSIYDDASPVESRFRKKPEYKLLFREIFEVLKRAAEAKDEGESLPLLDDRLPVVYQQQLKVPPVTPAHEDMPAIPLEINSLNAQEVHPVTEDKITKPVKCSEAPIVQLEEKDGKSQPCDVMESLAQGIRPKRNMSRSDRRVQLAIRRNSHQSPSPSQSRSSSKKRNKSKARNKQERLTNSPNRSAERHQQKSNKPVTEVLNNLEIFDKIAAQRQETSTAGKRERPVSMFALGTGNCSASQEVAKLKILEKSYADVLRAGRKKSGSQKPGH